MKKIEAIVRADKVHEIKEALHKIDIDFLSYWDVTGVGIEKWHKAVYRGVEINTEYIPRSLVYIVVNDSTIQKTISCLLKTAYTGEIGDGKIFVSEITESYRIRTGESGDESLYFKQKAFASK